MRASSFRVSEGRTLLCAKKLIVLQSELVVRLHLPTISAFKIWHFLSRFEVLLQTRIDEVLSASAHVLKACSLVVRSASRPMGVVAFVSKSTRKKRRSLSILQEHLLCS